jgi:hypothetical protein
MTFCWNRIPRRERRPDCCRLGMGSAFSSPDAGLLIYYTHVPRLCQVNCEATLRRRPWPETGPLSAEGPSRQNGGMFRVVSTHSGVPKAPLLIQEGRRISAGVVTRHRPAARSSRRYRLAKRQGMLSREFLWSVLPIGKDFTIPACYFLPIGNLLRDSPAIVTNRHHGRGRQTQAW